MMQSPSGPVSGSVDPRLSILDKRLSGLQHVLVFASAKGGVGKSSLACLSALNLAKNGSKAGLLDLDFHGASSHIFLGIHPDFPEEEGGILPLDGPEGLKFMSITAFTGDSGLPLRGNDISNAIIEILAVTIWRDIDILVIDMPPGIGDEVLDLLRFIKKSEFFLVTSPSVVSRKITSRLEAVLRDSGVEVKGLIINMDEADDIVEINATVDENAGLIGSVPMDTHFEEKIGKPRELLASAPAIAMDTILRQLGYIS